MHLTEEPGAYSRGLLSCRFWQSVELMGFASHPRVADTVDLLRGHRAELPSPASRPASSDEPILPPPELPASSSADSSSAGVLGASSLATAKLDGSTLPRSASPRSRAIREVRLPAQRGVGAGRVRASGGTSARSEQGDKCGPRRAPRRRRGLGASEERGRHGAFDGTWARAEKE
jgi:hypothetical protein